jgi:hydroxypyruvate isomerase
MRRRSIAVSHAWDDAAGGDLVKFSVPDWCFYGKLGEGRRYYDQLKELGVDAVEMTPPGRCALARAAGLEIVNQAGPGMQEGLNRRENHARLLPAIRAALDAAGAAGIPLLIVFSGNRAGQADREGIENCRRGLEALLPAAEKARVLLGFEMLCSQDHADYQADHGSYGFALVNAVGSPRLRIVYDIYHMEKMGDDSAVDVVANLGSILHLHVAESPARGLPLADGVIRYRSIVPKIVAAGYRGYWGLEFVPRGDPLDELSRSIAMLREAGGR